MLEFPDGHMQQSQLRTPPRMLLVRNTRNWVRRLPVSGGTGVNISFLSFLVTCHERSPLGHSFAVLGASRRSRSFAPLTLSSIVQDGSFFRASMSLVWAPGCGYVLLEFFWIRELMGVVIFFWIRELLGLLCSSGFPRVYSSFYSSLLVPPFILPSQLFARSRIRGVLSGSTGKIVLSTVRHLAQLARLPPIFFSSTGRAVLSTVRHLAPAGMTSIQFPQLAYVAATWRSRREFRRGRSTQLDTKGLVSIVRSIRLLFAGTRYWVLEVPPRGRLRLCNRLRSVVGREDSMAMAVARRLLWLLLRASTARLSGSCLGCVLTF